MDIAPFGRGATPLLLGGYRITSDFEKTYTIMEADIV
ncbi:hypothetical protein ABHD89_002718 [Salinicoccus halitifaciens]|uniref:Uncharacterized protein n=1 Tax=Salinicoccus halitifaciens TaxID=1073415 RepID=A0ABV2ECX3_9STAP